MLNRAWILLPILAVSVLLAGHGAAYGLLPVAPSSSTYTTGNGTLIVEFSEPVTMVDYTKLYIRDAGRSSIDIVLADVSDKTHDTDTMTFTLDSDQRTAFDTMLIPYLAVDHAAVHGQFDNPILEGYHILTVHDTEPPGFASAAYHTGMGKLTITFDENVFIPDYSKMHIRDSGNSTGGITLVGIAGIYQDRLDILFVMLNASQRTAFEDLTAPELDIYAGAVSDDSDNPIVAAPDQTIVIDDTTAPSVDSVTYDTNLGMLLITFDEPVTISSGYSKMHIRDSGNSTGGITISSLARLDHTADTVSALLNANEKVTFHGLSIPQLDMDAGAASDPSKNDMVDQNDIPITINDTLRPSFESARYGTSDNVLSITFSENVTVGASAVLRIHDINPGNASGISFGTADLSASGNTVNTTLSISQIAKIDGMHAPRLDIDADAVSDNSTNFIRSAKNLEVIIDDAMPPALVHAKYFTGNSTMSLTFSMPVDNVDYSKIRMHDSGNATSIQFDSFLLRYIDHNVVIVNFERGGGLIESMTTPQLDIDAGAVSEDDHILNTNRAAANLTINVHDTTPPEVDSATYTTGNGTLTVRFNEPISQFNYAKMHIIDFSTLGRGISLADVASIQHTAGTDTMTATLDSLQRTAFETMGTHLFRIDRSEAYDTAAAYDMSANAIRATSPYINVSDTTPPAFVSSTYNAALNMTTVTFDEPILNPDYSKVHIRESGASTGGITLGTISQKQHSTNFLSVEFSESQNDAFVALGTPQLDIDAGAVSDESDNPIIATPDLPIIQDDTTLPIVQSVEYDTNLEMLSITFDEPVHIQNSSRLHIRDSGENTGGIPFDDIPRILQTGTIMHAILNSSLVSEFNAMSEPHLDVDQDAVRDYSKNKITTTINIQITINDTTRPSVESVEYKPIHDTVKITSAVYHPGFGNMTIMFTEPVTEPDLADLYVRDYVRYVSLNMSINISKSDPITNQTITVWFDEPHQSEIHRLDTPLFGIKRGAVSDNSTNQILPFLDRFTIVDIIPPYLRIALLSPDRGEVTLYFTENVVDVAANPGDFLVQYAGVNATATDISVSGRSATLTLDQMLPEGTDDTFPHITYIQTSGHIQDLSGNNFENEDFILNPIENQDEYDNFEPSQITSTFIATFLTSEPQMIDGGDGNGGNGGDGNGGDGNGGDGNGGDGNGGDGNGGDGNGGDGNGGDGNGGDGNGGDGNGGDGNGGDGNGGDGNGGDGNGGDGNGGDGNGGDGNGGDGNGGDGNGGDGNGGDGNGGDGNGGDGNNGNGGNGGNLLDSSDSSSNNRRSSNIDPPIMDLNALRSSQFNIDIPYELLKIVHDHDWRTPTSPIVVNGTFDYPVTINGLGYPLGGMSSTLESQEVVADQPTSIDFVVYDYRTIAHFTIYMNLHDTDIHYFNSDTFIRFDNGNLQVTDPNNLLSNVTVTQETDEKYSFKTNVNILVTFNDTMGSTNMVVRAWNSGSSTMLAHMIDAITVIPAANATATTNSTDSIISTPTPGTSEAEMLQTIRMWAGFDSTPATDAELLEALDLSQDGEIPSWVKPNLGRMVSLGHITVDEFVMAVSYLIGE